MGVRGLIKNSFERFPSNGSPRGKESWKWKMEIVLKQRERERKGLHLMSKKACPLGRLLSRRYARIYTTSNSKFGKKKQQKKWKNKQRVLVFCSRGVSYRCSLSLYAFTHHV